MPMATVRVKVKTSWVHDFFASADWRFAGTDCRAPQIRSAATIAETF